MSWILKINDNGIHSLIIIPLFLYPWQIKLSISLIIVWVTLLLWIVLYDWKLINPPFLQSIDFWYIILSLPKFQTTGTLFSICWIYLVKYRRNLLVPTLLVIGILIVFNNILLSEYILITKASGKSSTELIYIGAKNWNWYWYLLYEILLHPNSKFLSLLSGKLISAVEYCSNIFWFFW